MRRPWVVAIGALAAAAGIVYALHALREGSDDELVICNKTITLVVHVTDEASGRPVPDVSATVQHPDQSGSERRVAADSAGRVTVEFGRPGTCVLRLEAKGFRRTRVEVPLSQSREIDVALLADPFVSPADSGDGAVVTSGGARVVDPEGAGVPGAAVRIVELAWVAGSEAIESRRKIAEATTGPDGRFALQFRTKSSEWSRYYLEIESASHATHSFRLDTAPAGDYTLSRDSRVVGGHVLELETDAPIPGATIDLFLGTPGPEGNWRIAADSEGAFTIAVPRGGTGSALASAEGHEPATLSPLAVVEPSVQIVLRLSALARLAGRVVDRKTRQAIAGAPIVASWDSGWNSVPVVSGADGSFELSSGSGAVRLRTEATGYVTYEGPRGLFLLPGESKPDIEIALEAGRRLVVEVSDARGVPVEGASVEIRHGVRIAREGPTDAQGRFVTRELTSREAYVVRVSHPLSAPAEGRAKFGKDGELVVKIRLEAGGSIWGRVVDAAGRPLEHAAVTAKGIRKIPAVTTDSRGVFRIARVAPGRYLVAPSLAGRRARESRSVTVEDGLESPAGDLVLDEASALDFEIIAPGAAPETVTVLWRAKKGGMPKERTFTLAERRSIEDLLPGAYRASAIAPGLASPAPQTIEIPPGRRASATFVFTRGLGIEGTVRDAAGKAIGATVLVEPEGVADEFERRRLSRSTTSDATRGRYVVGGLPPGAYRFEASAPGRVPARGSIEVAEASGRARLDLTFPQGGRIVGVVRDAAGNPVAGALVQAATRSSANHQTFSRETESATDGAFELAGLPPGTFEVRAYLVLSDPRRTLRASARVVLSDGAVERVGLVIEERE